MKIHPLKDRVIVEPTPHDETTEGGLIIPEEAKHPPVKGKVLAAGPGTKDIPMDVKEGDHVVFLQGAGIDIEFEKKTLKIIRSLDIICIEEK